MNAPKSYVLTTVALLGLLALTLGSAFLKLGPFNVAVAMLISAAKGALILLVFMRLRRAGPLIRIFACAGLFWLGLLFALALSDYLSRTP